MSPQKKYTEAPPLPIRFVLLRPHNSCNIGAAARALKNFGYGDWCIVGKQSSIDLNSARNVAVHACDLMDSLRIFDKFEDAVSDCTFITGTSSRHVHGREFLTPEQWAEKASAAASSPSGKIAIVFGEERSGMSNAEILRCHALSGIPTLPEQPSLNLAQAVLLYSYEARRASIALHQKGAPPPRMPERCTNEALIRIEELIREILVQSGFSKDQRERAAVRDLMSLILRSGPCLREGRLLEAALHSILKSVRKE